MGSSYVPVCVVSRVEIFVDADEGPGRDVRTYRADFCRTSKKVLYPKIVPKLLVVGKMGKKNKTKKSKQKNKKATISSACGAA